MTILYVAVTYWLDSVRSTAPSWLLWTLILVQFALYVSYFIKSHNFAIVRGFNQYISLVVFVILACLGRVNDWEIVIIPLAVIIALVVSRKSLADN